MKKFTAAVQGVIRAFKNDRSFIVHGIAALLVVLAGWFFQVSGAEWMILILCIATVITAELFNTAIESLCNMVEPNYNKKIGFIKDVAAGAVLIVTIAAVIIGLIIFIPKLICLWPC